MSQPRTPFADVEASLDKTKRAWIEQMLAELAKSKPSTSAAPLLQGGIPVGPVEKMLEQERIKGIKVKLPAEQAVEVEEKWEAKEAKRLAEEAKRQAEEEKKQAEEARRRAIEEEQKPWSFEDAMKKKYGDLPPVFEFPAKQPILGPDESLGVRDDAYDKLPKDLKEKMTPEVWAAIKGERANLFMIYMRLREYGAWKLVGAVTGIKEGLKAHGTLGAIEFGVYGTGGIAFEENSQGAVAAKLVSTGQFGQDNKIMALWHTGQKSYREWRKEQITPTGVLDESIHEWGQKDPPPTSSMHLSTGPGKSFDAHIDRISPVNKPIGGESIPNTRSGKHIGTEAIAPDAGGVQPDLTVKREKDAPHGVNVTFWVNFINLEWDVGGGKTKKKVHNIHLPQFAPLPSEFSSIIEQARRLGPQFPKTSEDDIDAGILAEFIASSVLAAAKAGGDTVKVDFPNYSNTKLSVAEQKTVREIVQEIGKIVSSVLGFRMGTVTNVTVYLPAQKALNFPIEK